jgi:hypothetical protein
MSRRLTSFLPFIALLVCGGLGVSAQIKVAPDKGSAHILTITENRPDPKIPIEPLTGLPGTSTLVRNRARSYRAFVLCIPAEVAGRSCNSRVFFTNERTKATYMITGETDGVEAARPIDELKWLDNTRLSYERWVSPHYGHRYIVNVRTRLQTGSFIVADPVKGS